MRIAYIEDNPINKALVDRVTSMRQDDIVWFREGETALQVLSGEKFDLVLVDVQLADEMTGLQLVGQLRARGFRTPIVAITSYAMSGDRERCLTAGCDEYLPNPLPIREFLSLLERYERQRPKAAV
jgi:CheY-like chemotaxis protein